MAVQKKTSVAAFEAMLDLPENAGKTLELLAGEVVEKGAANRHCSAVAAKIIYFIMAFLARHPLGHVTGADGGYYISDEDYFVPDVAYISKERQPELPRKGFNPIPPDLAVEVVSPTDSYSEVARKVAVYLRGGTRLVWGAIQRHRRWRCIQPLARRRLA